MRALVSKKIRQAPTVPIAFGPNSEVPVSHGPKFVKSRPGLVDLARDVFGILYMLASVSLGIYSIFEVYPYFNNANFWPNYISANVSSSLIHLYNFQLPLLDGKGSLNLLNPLATLSVHDSVGQNLVYPRSIIFKDLTDPFDAISGLRNIALVNIVYLITQYCWVDFEKRWAIAHTRKRQERCNQRYQRNGAVYMESVFRNIAFKAWKATTQGMFQLRVGAGVAEFPDGVLFLSYLESHELVSIDKEIDYWTSFGITKFILQYSNQYQNGIEEVILIRNALGMDSTLYIKTISTISRGTLWTTAYLYSGLQSDFATLGGNQSLVQNATTYFGLTDDNIMEEYNICSPLPPAFQAIHNSVGPMGNIDAYWIEPPPELVLVVQSFRSQLLKNLYLDPVLGKALAAIGTYIIHPTPIQWANSSLVFYGGNLMCGFGAGLSFVQESFGFDDACATQLALAINWNPISTLFAYSMVQHNISYFCQLLAKTERSLCLDSVSSLTIAASSVNDLDFLEQANSINFIKSSQISFMQFVSSGSNGGVHVELQRLLDPSFAFFGWMCFYDWALGQREAVSFEGDVQLIPLMSYALQPQTPHQINAASSGLGLYLFFCYALVSIALCGIAILLLALWMYYRPRNSPWFTFNRITSATWLNRSMLVLRGLCAILCLSSGTAIPVVDATGLRFIPAPRSFVVSCLFVSEATWLTYVIHESLLPLFDEFYTIYIKWSSLLSWCILLALDVLNPVQVTAVIDRKCFSKNMDQMVYCTSGSVSIGQRDRAIINIVVLGCSALVAVATALLHEKFKSTTVSGQGIASLNLPAVGIAFLSHSRSVGFTSSTIEVVGAGMCGVFRLNSILFDLKLWRPLSAKSYGFEFCDYSIRLPNVGVVTGQVSIFSSIINSMHNLNSIALVKAQVRYIGIWIGVAYTVLTLCSNVAYMTMAQEFLANDFGWSGFNTSGMHAFIGNVFNVQLLISTTHSANLTEPFFADTSQLYNGSISRITWSFNAPRRQLLNPTVSLESFVQGLRQMNPCMMPWMFTQYCFVDFDRTWTMASTIKRQSRCKQYINNAAVYLEAPLRNIHDWNMWQQCWGTSFDIGFAQYLQTTQKGRSWLINVQSNSNSIDNEAALWRQYGITTFQLQWQNYKTMGMTDYFTITSALGYTSSLTLSNFAGNYHVAQQTSMRMYWTFASDLWAVTTNATWIGGKSLVMESPLFAFGNVSSEVLLYQNLTLIQPLNAGLLVLRSTLGPFGCIDMKYIFPPNELLDLYGKTREEVHRLLLSDSQAQIDFFSIPAKLRSCETPPYLLSDPSFLAIGGNLMCGNDLPPEPMSWGLLSGFGPTNVCYAMFLEKMLPPTIEIIFAFLGVNFTYGPIVNDDFDGICLMDTCGGPSCATDFHKTYTFLQSHIASFTSLQSMFLAAEQQIRLLNIQTIQYYTMLNDTTTTYLYHINILEPTERLWTFYGWCLSFEWANGVREVVQFIGDKGSMTSITYQTPPISMTPDPTEIPVSFASAFLGCTFYITWILICIAGVVTMYSIAHRGHIEGMNLFELNRIVGHVWAGRTFLVIRSITAIWILNTAPLNLVQVGQATHLTSPQLPWYQTILAASEVTWLVYALNDMFSFVTEQYTTYYAYKSSLSTWCVISVWSLLSPLTYSAALHRECSYVDMDFGLVCTSGSIEVGRTRGVLGVMGVATLCVVVSYLLERLCYPSRAPCKVNTMLLCSQSLYMLDLSHWHYRGEYYLDRTSAIMAGLLSVEYKKQLYIFDIKLWRVLIIPIQYDTPPFFRKTIPISRL